MYRVTRILLFKWYILSSSCCDWNCVRGLSTPHPSHTKKRKKGKNTKSVKKCDLLEVRTNYTKQSTAIIKKIPKNYLNLLTSTNLSFDQIAGCRQVEKPIILEEHTYNNWTSYVDGLRNSTNFKTSVELVPSVINEDIAGTFTPNVSESNPEILLEKEVEEEIADETLEEIHDDLVDETTPTHTPYKIISKSQKAKFDVALSSLSSYLDVCSMLNIPHKGMNALAFHNNRAVRGADKDFTVIKNISVYNSILKGFALRGDTKRINEVVQLIKRAEIKMNIQSLVYILECYGRQSDEDCSKVLLDYISSVGLIRSTINKFLNEGIFSQEQRPYVEKALKILKTNYDFKQKKLHIQYNNPLVNKLNCSTQLKDPSVSEYFITLKANEKNRFMEPEQIKERIRTQMYNEKSTTVVINSVLADDNTGSPDVENYRSSLDSLYKKWTEDALIAFNRDLATLSAQRNPLNYDPYMRSIPAKDIAEIIVDEAKKLAQGSETYSPTVSQLYRELGHKVYSRYKVQQKHKLGVLNKITDVHNDYCNWYCLSHGQPLDELPLNENPYNNRHLWQWAELKQRHSGASICFDHSEWNMSVLQTIGKFLYRIVMNDLKVDANSMKINSKHKNYLPAFYTIFRNQCRIVKEEVKPHPVLAKLYKASIPTTLQFPANELPMLCPPLPWISAQVGGYLLSSCEVIRLPTHASIQKRRVLQMDPIKLYPSLDALNLLASTPWRVNETVLDVILGVFKNGGSNKLNVPEPPSSLEVPSPITPSMSKEDKNDIFRQRLQYRRKKAEMYSLWCDCLYRLSLANHYRKEIFWLPHNMDFRGRVYPIPPHLNHLGSDLARSMLMFAEARPLGPSGLDWLKIHVINLTGLKKRDSLAERLSYANQIMDRILDSAADPLNGKWKWWMESDEPWQTLACCMEISKAVYSGDVEKYMTHFPIHQDGSCNGLQHYAALGRDSIGAHSVNLCETKEPQDVYSAVVNLVEQQRQRDADGGLAVAKSLEGFVTRKVIKQTVMTTVYGVTRFGARLQIARQLKDIENFPKELVWTASSYLTGKTFESLRTMFTSTKEIQDWFTECARLVSSVCGQHVEWISPLGLPIVQPYIKFKSATQNALPIYKTFSMDQFERPNVMKQKNAFPPNFIHSLDSTHMMLTSLYCERANITFVSVHDCFWTHPSTINIMNKICREQFVALHSQPILQNLSAYLAHKYSFSDTRGKGSAVDLVKKKLNRTLVEIPKQGSFDIREVLRSLYFFS